MDVIRLGAFELHPSERRLCEGARQIELGSRAFDLLLVLVENAGRLVTKATLLERVWPRLVVDENNLPAQIASLRRALGAGAIRTVPGFGYRLELQVISSSAPGAPAVAERAAPARRTWSERLTPLVGRLDDLRGIEDGFKRSCVVTVVGTPGVGKTRLAEEILARQLLAPANACVFVPVAALGTVAEVPAAIALALGLALPDDADGFAALDRALDQAPWLIVLDSVEHLAESLAAPLTQLAARHRSLKLLLTSQIPLGIQGEMVYRLGALPLPPAGAAVPEAAGSPAIALFAQRAAAADRGFELNAANVGVVADICRRLDGNPLALELAAARVPALGVVALHDRLDDRFRLLKGNGRATDGRHGALRTAFEWSYGLLKPAEQRVFDRLGAFAGSFSLEAASRSVADVDIDTIDAIDLIGRLVDRSLVTALPLDPPRYALLETARVYALDRLAETGELEAARARMATATLQQMDAAYDQYWSLDEALWLQRYAPELDNVRHAMDWSAEHDRTIAVALYGSTWPLFVEAELLAEARVRYEQTVRLLTDTLPLDRLARFWEAVATFHSTRQCDRSRYAAEIAARMHAQAGDLRSTYYALTQLVLNWRDANDAAREAFVAARALENPAWPARLLTHGALTEGALLLAAGDLPGARDACRRAVRLALTVSERQALAATVRIVELDLASGDTAAALQLGRPLTLSLRYSNQHATRIDLLTLVLGALLLEGALEEARRVGGELHSLAVRMDPGKLYLALDAMALLVCLERRFELGARLSRFASHAQEVHGQARRRPTDERLHHQVGRTLDAELGADWRQLTLPQRTFADESDACAIALGLSN